MGSEAHAKCRQQPQANGMVAITVRNVPNEVRDELASQAASAGKSLDGYLRELLRQAAQRPPLEELLRRVRTRVEAFHLSIDPDRVAAAIREDRDDPGC